MAITDTYMDKIGFGRQPFLVYQHYDAGHPHVHIVSVNIERDGKRIDMHHLGIRKSEPARKEIEELFGLVKAEGRKKIEQFKIEPISMGKVRYGKIESKKALTNVLTFVLNQYKYSSLPELNAILKQYNVLADRGSEKSRVFLENGLVYRILDEKGIPVGVPVKASDFYNKPTLKFLEEKFRNNKIRTVSDQRHVKNNIDMVILKKDKISLTEFEKELQKEGINTLFRKSETGLVYGITYVDHVTKNVFNGSSLGKEYSAKGILERCEPPIVAENKQQLSERLKAFTLENNSKKTLDVLAICKLIDSLLQPEMTYDYLPKQLKKKKKRRIRKGI